MAGGHRARSKCGLFLEAATAGPRIMTWGHSAGSQKAGASSADRWGSAGKAKAPPPGHHLLGRRVAIPIRHDPLIVAAICGIAAKKFLRETREIEPGASDPLVPCFLRHARLRGRHEIWRRHVSRQFHGTGSHIPRNGYPARRCRAGAEVQSPRRDCRFQTRSCSSPSPAKSCAKIGAVKLGSSSLTDR